jgi:hypothetical protein
MTVDMKNTWIIQNPGHKLIGLPCDDCGKPFNQYDLIKTGERKHFKCRSPQYGVIKPNEKLYRVRVGDIVRYQDIKQLVQFKTRSRVKLVPVRKNGQTGEWRPTRRAFWHPIEEVRQWAIFLERSE